MQQFNKLYCKDSLRIRKNISAALLLTICCLFNPSNQSIFKCYETALAYKNTCNGSPYYAEDWNTFVTRDVTCNLMERCPIGASGTAPNCTWKRKLCVSCSSENGNVYMRIQSNGLPDHCVPGKIPLQEKIIDIKFLFNPPPVTFFAKPRNVNELNHMICDFDSSSNANLPADSQFRNLGDSSISIVNMVGIATNGVLMYNGNSPRNTDYFYPKDWSGSNQMVVDQDLDACLGAITPEDGVYHYWFLPPCLYNSDKLQPSKYCDAVPECASNMANYAQQIYTEYQSFWTLIGMAKDGHQIIGPYKEDGSEWDCNETDICNGYRDIVANNYTYVGVTTFPYVVGCYGPGAYVKFNSECSQNQCRSNAKLLSEFMNIFGILAALVFTGALF